MIENRRRAVWGIHATEEPCLLIERNCIALGWERIGDLNDMPRNRAEFKARYAELRADCGESKQAVANVTGQLLRFAWDAAVGDYVVYAVSGKSDVYIGRITGEYRYEPDAVMYNQQRDVKWFGRWERRSFSPGAQSSLGVLMTFWRIGDFADEFLQRIGVVAGGEVQIPHDVMVLSHLYSHLSGREFEVFVSDILNACGYDTQLTGKSGDHGVDIVATCENQLIPQRVKVQVKRQNNGVGENCVQQLRGALEDGWTGAIVSYGGLQPAAEVFARSHGIAIIDGRRIRDLAILHEEALCVKWPQVYQHEPGDDLPDEEEDE